MPIEDNLEHSRNPPELLWNERCRRLGEVDVRRCAALEDIASVLQEREEIDPTAQAEIVEHIRGVALPAGGDIGADEIVPVDYFLDERTAIAEILGGVAEMDEFEVEER